MSRTLSMNKRSDDNLKVSTDEWHRLGMNRLRHFPTVSWCSARRAATHRLVTLGVATRQYELRAQGQRLGALWATRPALERLTLLFAQGQRFLRTAPFGHVHLHGHIQERAFQARSSLSLHISGELLVQDTRRKQTHGLIRRSARPLYDSPGAGMPERYLLYGFCLP
jgi:hypothetical protein